MPQILDLGLQRLDAIAGGLHLGGRQIHDRHGRISLPDFQRFIGIGDDTFGNYSAWHGITLS